MSQRFVYLFLLFKGETRNLKGLFEDLRPFHASDDHDEKFYSRRGKF